MSFNGGVIMNYKILNIIENLSNEIGIDVNIYRLEEI